MRSTYLIAIHTKGKTEYRAGCFTGTLEEFRAKVRSVYGEEGHGKGYLGLANYIEWHFNDLHKR